MGTDIPMSDPVSVLARLHTFRDNIVRALQKKPSKSRREEPPQLPFVSKWVDYSRKHGIGFVLEDGTVGCLTVATSKHPVTSAYVHEGQEHLLKLAKDPTHMAQLPIEFVAASKEAKALTRVQAMEKHRRDQLQVLWQKFARYMCVQLGIEDAPRKKTPCQSNFVKFYQRLGNVGFWGFGDGSFQVMIFDKDGVVTPLTLL
jgi:myosin-1